MFLFTKFKKFYSISTKIVQFSLVLYVYKWKDSPLADLVCAKENGSVASAFGITEVCSSPPSASRVICSRAPLKDIQLPCIKWYYLQITYAHLLIYFKSSLDHSRVLAQCKCYRNRCFTVFCWN